MKTLAIGSIFVLFAIVASLSMVPSVFADHATAEVQMGIGSGVPGCEETNECYIPYEVTVDIGGEVTWINDDDVFHTVTASDPDVDKTMTGTDPNGFDSGIFEKGKTFTHKFTEAGTYPYYCIVHPWMKGIVNVEGEVMDDTHDDHADDMMSGDGHMDSMPESLDEVMATITAGEAMEGSPVSIDVAITDLEGGQLEHVNFKVIAMQGDEMILDMEVHAHDGMETLTTAPVPMPVSDEMPVDITVELAGFGVDEITGPQGELATAQVVPEFGTIAMMILGISIISIIAITAKSRVIPRI